MVWGVGVWDIFFGCDWKRSARLAGGQVVIRRVDIRLGIRVLKLISLTESRGDDDGVFVGADGS